MRPPRSGLRPRSRRASCPESRDASTPFAAATCTSTAAAAARRRSVFESGLGDSHRAWQYVAPEVWRTRRPSACTTGGARLQPARSEARDGAREGEGLCTRCWLAARVKPPYVLVGHSYGGMLVHVYAADYPQDVARCRPGRLLASRSERANGSRRSRRRAPVRIRAHARPLRPQGAGVREPEGVDWARSSDEARAAGSLGTTPLVVLTGRPARLQRCVPP
jgi:pimeloyl-ACP methyl ester carboxylesterase